MPEHSSKTVGLPKTAFTHRRPSAASKWACAEKRAALFEYHTQISFNLSRSLPGHVCAARIGFPRLANWTEVNQRDVVGFQYPLLGWILTGDRRRVFARAHDPFMPVLLHPEARFSRPQPRQTRHARRLGAQPRPVKPLWPKASKAGHLGEQTLINPHSGVQ